VKPPVALPVHVRAEVPDVVTLVGVRVHVRPVVGEIDVERSTLPVKPLIGATDMVDDAGVPILLVRLVGFAETEKSGVEGSHK